MRPITYSRSDTTVEPGDRIRLKRWFRRSPGTVVYVPGISPPNPNFGDEYVSEVGIRTDDGRIYGVIVYPETSLLRETVSFERRGDRPPPELPLRLDDPTETN